ncbi:PAS domain S-box protein [Massilia sp. PWRC2]|uniref:PAS domain-containing sensor histidine kinase n=1 Tax=Massilia sp. PWRC2 TaxID=2804626 RepID=UPI003CFAC4FE
MMQGGATIVMIGAVSGARAQIRAILQQDGHTLADVDAGDGAAAAIVRQGGDLVVIEMSNGPRGRALVRSIKSALATRHLPVLVLHAPGSRRARLAALAAGADAVMTACDGAELRLNVRNLLRLAGSGRRPLAASAGMQMTNDAMEVAIIDALPANIGLIDRSGTLLSVNKAWRGFADANGMPASSQFGIGSNYLALCEGDGCRPGDSGNHVGTGIRQVLSGSIDHFSMEYPCQAPDGERWFLMTVSPLGEGPEGAIVMHVDVTQKHLTKQSLHDSNMQFGQMADNIRDIFFLLDVARWRVLYVSPAYDDIVGRPRAGLGERPEAWLDVIVPEHRGRVAAEYAAHLARTDQPFECAFQIRRPDQQVRWLSMKLFQIREVGGAVTRMAGIAQDITESKMAIRKLRESERRFLELLNNTSMLAVMLDLDAQITFCNSALLNLMGLHDAQVVGANWFDVFMASAPAASRANFLARLAQGAGASRYEDEVVKRNGERRLICWNTSVLHDIDGRVIGTASIGEDITEQKASELKILKLNANLEKMSGQLLQAQEQERISLARELHDELGQHLALLKIDLFHLRGSLHDAPALALWDKTDAAVVTLIAQIRAISVSLRPPTLDYLGLESALRQLLERQFASGACRYVFEYAGLPARLAPPVEIAIYRIVQESTTNIMRHAHASSVVVELNGGESGRELESLVRDNGVGFERGGAGIDAHDGSGNGLRGMQERVKLLGGRFDVVSSTTGGTRIAVALSLEPA